MANPLVTKTINQIADLCALTPDQRAVWEKVCDPCNQARQVEVLGATLLAQRKFRIFAWGRAGSGKTRAFRKLAESLSRPIRYLSADEDTVHSTALDPVGVSIAPCPKPDDQAALLAHIIGNIKALRGAISAGAVDAKAGKVSGIVLDSLTMWASKIWEDFGSMEMLQTLEKLSHEASGANVAGNVQMSGNRGNIATTAAIKAAGFSVYSAADGEILRDAWGAPGPVVLGVVAHAKSIPQTDQRGNPVMGSHRQWLLQLGPSTARDAMAVTQFALGFAIDTKPDEPIRQRQWEWDTQKHPNCKARLHDEDPYEIDLMRTCAKTCDLAGLVQGLYQHRTQREIDRLAKAAGLT